MAKKGGNRHLKRYAAPRSLKLSRKSFTWVTKPSAGPHPHESAIPLRLVLTKYLSLARNSSEADKLLFNKSVCVDAKVRREPSFPVGLMDVVSLPEIGRNYRVFFDHRKRLILNEVDKSEASVKLCKVVRKQVTRGGKVQLTFHDGKTLSGDFKEFKPGDVAKISLPELKVLEHLPLEAGATAMLIGGSNVSKVGKVTELRVISGTQPNIVTLESDGVRLQAPKGYVFVIGREKSSVSFPGARK